MPFLEPTQTLLAGGSLRTPGASRYLVWEVKDNQMGRLSLGADVSFTPMSGNARIASHHPVVVHPLNIREYLDLELISDVLFRFAY
jgi:hypothetical protein